MCLEFFSWRWCVSQSAWCRLAGRSKPAVPLPKRPCPRREAVSDVQQTACEWSVSGPWVEHERRKSRSTYFCNPRSPLRSRSATSRSATSRSALSSAPSFSATPAHRSALLHPIFGPLRSVFRSAHAPLICSNSKVASWCIVLLLSTGWQYAIWHKLCLHCNNPKGFAWNNRRNMGRTGHMRLDKKLKLVV